MSTEWKELSTTAYHLFYNNPFSQRLLPGWYKDTLVMALDLGEINIDWEQVAAAPLFIPITGFDQEGTPQLVEGQYFIFSTSPLDSNYSSFCQAVFLQVPPDYQANSLRSQQAVKTAGYQRIISDLTLLLPIL